MKKTFAILLALVMAIGLFAGCATSDGETTGATTAGTPSTPVDPNPSEGGDSVTKAQCAYCGSEVDWTAWTNTDSLPAEGGHYILQNDVTLTAECQWQNIGVLCLDLNGKTVTQTTVGQRIAYVEAAAINLFDSSADGTGKIRPCSAPETENLDVMKHWWAVGFLCGGGSEMNLYGGTIDCSGLTVGKYGGCIVMDAGTLNIYDGVKLIGGNTVAPGSGGSALAILGPAECNMHGGEIVGGNVQSEHNSGGGGTLRVSGTMHVRGGTITGGTTNKDGGCMYISGTVYVYDGALITGGTADGQGDTIFVKSGGRLMLGAGVEMDTEIVGELVDANG